MKKIRNIFLVGLVSLGLSSCDWVDFDPLESYTITADVYFNTAADYEAAVVGAYDPLQWLNAQHLMMEIASDNTVSGGESATDVIAFQEVDMMSHYPENDQLTNLWKFMYEGINRTNYLAENKDKIEFDGKEELFGEVYFLRAYYYFDLVRLFGGVPLFTESRLTASDSGTLQRATTAEVYAQIETDLQAAIAVLPSVSGNNQNGRANRVAAQALLGKVYLYQEKFSDAAAMLENVIGTRVLLDDYSSQFLREGENGLESIFEVQHSDQSVWWDWGYNPQGTEGNFGIIHMGPRAYSGPLFASGWSFNLPVQELYDSYEDGDQRRDGTILNMESWKADNDADYTPAYKDTGFFNLKYIPRAGYSETGQTELNYLNNWRIIRYSDVLLMAAEAYNRGAIDDSKAQLYLNMVRQRAFQDTDHNVSLTGSALTEAIWNERNFELALEGHRFFDLVRTGKAAEKIDGFTAGKNELFPIPQQEVDISNLEQNPGY